MTATSTPARTRVSRSRWRVVAGVVVAAAVLLGIYIPFTNTAAGGDHYGSALTAWSIATTGSADLSPFVEAKESLWLFAVGDEVVTNRFPGAVLYAVPFYAVGDLFTDRFSMWPGVVAASTFAAAAVLLMWAALLPMGRRVALGGAAIFGLGTATFAVSADTQWSHAPAQTALAAAVLALTRGRLGWAGVALGMAVVVRPHLPSPPWPSASGWLPRRGRRRPRSASASARSPASRSCSPTTASCTIGSCRRTAWERSADDVPWRRRRRRGAGVVA